MVRVENGVPEEACECTRCKEGANEHGVGDDDVSDFFASCHMWRGRSDVHKASVDNKQSHSQKKNSIKLPILTLGSSTWVPPVFFAFQGPKHFTLPLTAQH